MLTGLIAAAQELDEDQHVLCNFFSMVDGADKVDNGITFHELLDTLDLFDSNADAKFTPEELRGALQELNGKVKSDQELDFADFDLKDDRKLHLWFDELDQDSDGYLVMEELFVKGFHVGLQSHQKWHQSQIQNSISKTKRYCSKF
ncbi:hypothetical protein CHS0354_020728 [Potamilus streckersoni]|nr:hypothetical protein CHS0354_020728 [Potamilus streckersoni]